MKPIKGRQQFGQNPRPQMKPEERAIMIESSMAILEVEFHNSPGSKRFWSKCNQRKHRNISDAINYLMWMVNNFKPWQGTIHRAAIFDARTLKDSQSSNKLYQYERNQWNLEQPITW
jgi:hypothetical protein